MRLIAPEAAALVLYMPLACPLANEKSTVVVSSWIPAVTRSWLDAATALMVMHRMVVEDTHWLLSHLV